MAVATPTLFRVDTDETEDRRYDTERDQKHDSHISDIFRHLMDPNARLDDFYDETGAVRDMAPAPAPVQEEEQAPIQQAYTAPEQQAFTAPEQQAYSAPAPQQTFQTGPQLVQSARVTSDLFRAKETYREAAPAAQAVPAAEAFDYTAYEVVAQSVSMPAPAAAAAAAEEENEDLVPTKTTRQYKSREDSSIESLTAKKSITLSKRDKILMFSIIGIVAVLFVLIIVNAAIISGLNSQVSEVEQEYNAVYSEYVEADNQISDYLTDLETNMDQYAANLGMTK